MSLRNFTSKKLSIPTEIRPSRQALRPVSLFWNRSIELNSLNNFYSKCLYNMLTRKKLSISTEIRLSRHALRPVEVNNLNNFVRHVLGKYLPVKRYESKCVKICRKFSSSSGQGELWRILSDKIENKIMRTITHCLNAQKMSG